MDRVAATAPKRLLSLDGGGLRGLISIEILAAIERLVGKPLARYFDYVAGTSTGAIIASCLALGMSVDEIREFFIEAGPSMFAAASTWNRIRFKYDHRRLAGTLRAIFKNPTDGTALTLGSAELKTLLLVVLRNATTDSPWPISNNPRAMFNDRGLADCNLDLPLWQLVRASTAAPTYFSPELIRLGSKEFVFVDGGVTPYNNPAFLLFRHATLEAHRLCWPTGPEKMLLVSVGTGLARAADVALRPGTMNLLYSASSIPAALIHAGSVEQDLLCRMFARCVHGADIDLEVGDMRWRGPEAPASQIPHLFTYVRYNADLSPAGLESLGLSALRSAEVQRLDAVDRADDLRRIGRAAAAQVSAAHFAGFLGEV